MVERTEMLERALEKVVEAMQVGIQLKDGGRVVVLDWATISAVADSLTVLRLRQQSEEKYGREAH